jgi:hypothetical protein
VGSSNLLSGNRTSTEAPSRSSSELASVSWVYK